MWVKHPLTDFQRYTQGIAILAKYSTEATFGTDRHKTQEYVSLKAVPTLPVQQDTELLEYLGWTLRQTLTPYANEEYKNHYELWFYFSPVSTIWKE